MPHLIMTSVIQALFLQLSFFDDGDEQAVHILSTLFPQIAHDDDIPLHSMLLSPSNSQFISAVVPSLVNQGGPATLHINRFCASLHPNNRDFPGRNPRQSPTASRGCPSATKPAMRSVHHRRVHIPCLNSLKVCFV